MYSVWGLSKLVYPDDSVCKHSIILADFLEEFLVLILKSYFPILNDSKQNNSPTKCGMFYNCQGTYYPKPPFFYVGPANGKENRNWCSGVYNSFMMCILLKNMQVKI